MIPPSDIPPIHAASGADGPATGQDRPLEPSGRRPGAGPGIRGPGAPVVEAAAAWLGDPRELGERMARFYADLWDLHRYGVARFLGPWGADPVPSDPIPPNPQDERFADPVWSQVPGWDLLKEWYLTLSRHTKDLAREAPGLSARDRRRAVFWWRLWLDALAPTNFLFANPVALRRAAETGGMSLAAGFRNFLADLELGSVRLTDPGDFRVGENLATTPGAVVFRNRLLEVIHYAPTRAAVEAEPVVIVTPWINKFYVLDLTPKKSLVRYLLDQGFDVYLTSWRNPDARLRELRMDDYLLEGIEAAVEVARGISGAKRVHAVGYCIGGTALAMYLAWANRRYAPERVPVADCTLFTTLVDFAEPGDIEVFIDETTVAWLRARMERQGYLDGAEMAAAFRLLRSNGLIWHYVVRGWLCGERPPPFDVLYWNMDATRMPATMHGWYLTELYLNNRLVEPGALTLAGEALDLGAITQPIYAVGAEDDHIAPWTQAYRIIDQVAGETRFVLSTSGHILGIINPPVDPPKRAYQAGTACSGESAAQWQARTPRQPGTWWDDWTAWLRLRSDGLIPAPPVATADYPELAPAPGTYVLER